MNIYYARLVKRFHSTYTVYSNVENASVLFNNTIVGTIQNGICQVLIDYDDALDSYSVTLQGGNLPADILNYTFNVTPTSLSFGSAAENKAVTVTSTLITTKHVHRSGTVTREGSVTLNYTTTETPSTPTYTSSSTGSGFSVSGNTVRANSNQSATSTTSQRTGTATFTQAGSNKVINIPLTQAGRTIYSFTVRSNYNGGTVYADNVNRGTISNGSLTFYDPSNSTKTIRISGGVPSPTESTTNDGTDTETGTDYDSTTEYDKRVGRTSFSFDHTGGSLTTTVYSSYREGSRSRSQTRTRPRYKVTTTTWATPASKTVAANNSVTMNYTSSNSSRTTYGSWSGYSYGSWSSWSYGSWQVSKPTVSAQSTWAPGSISGNGEPYTLTVTCQSTTSTSSRSDYFTINHAGGQTTRINLSQSGKPADVYVFRYSDETGGGTTAPENEVYPAHFPNNGGYDFTWYGCVSTLNGNNLAGGTAVASGSDAKEISFPSQPIYNMNGDMKACFRWSKNTSESKRGPATVTFTQSGSRKTIKTTEIYQCYVEFNLGTTGLHEYSFDISADGGQKSYWAACQETCPGVTGKQMPAWPTYSVVSNPTWCTFNKTSGLNNGDQLIINIAKNTATTSRSGVIKLRESHIGKEINITVKQAAASVLEVKDSSGKIYTSNFNYVAPAWKTGIAGSPVFSTNTPCDVTIINKPPTNYIASISGGGTNVTTFYVAPTSNAIFNQVGWTVRIVARDGRGSIDMNCTMGARENKITLKFNTAMNNAVLITKEAGTGGISLIAPLIQIIAGQTMDIKFIYNGGAAASGGNVPPFNNYDRVDTKKTFYAYRRNGSGTQATYQLITSFQADAINTTTVNF